MPRISDKEVQELINYACECTEYEYMKNKIKWRWNNRFTRMMGRANILFRTIDLSTKLFDLANEDEQWETVIHEACHILAFAHDNNINTKHGSVWLVMMWLCGIKEPRVYHTVNRDLIKQKRRKYTLYCSCRIHKIGEIRYHRLLSNQRKYKCILCSSYLTVKDYRKKEKE